MIEAAAEEINIIKKIEVVVERFVKYHMHLIALQQLQTIFYIHFFCCSFYHLYSTDDGVDTETLGWIIFYSPLSYWYNYLCSKLKASFPTCKSYYGCVRFCFTVINRATDFRSSFRFFGVLKPVAVPALPNQSPVELGRHILLRELSIFTTPLYLPKLVEQVTQSPTQSMKMIYLLLLVYTVE